MDNELMEAGFEDFMACCDMGILKDAMERIVKSAYIAGWKAAGGDLLLPGELEFAAEMSDY